jgi:hypothetical protein
MITDSPNVPEGVEEPSLPMSSPGHLVISHRIEAIGTGFHGAATKASGLSQNTWTRHTEISAVRDRLTAIP